MIYARVGGTSPVDDPPWVDGPTSFVSKRRSTVGAWLAVRNDYRTMRYDRSSIQRKLTHAHTDLSSV